MMKMPAHLPPLPDGYVYAGQLGDYRVGKRLPGVIFQDGELEWTGPSVWSGVERFHSSAPWHYAAPADSEIARLNGCGKPSWDDAPEWAEWLAQDADGGWVWYELKPRVGPISASDDGFEDWLLGRLRGMYEDAGEGPPNPNWRDTLERRPTKTSKLEFEIDTSFVRGAVDKAVKEIKEAGGLPDLIIPADVENELSTMELDPLIRAARFLGYRIEWSDEGIQGWTRE